MNGEYNIRSPYFRTIAEYYWTKGQPVIYRNEKGELLEYWVDGTFDVIDEDEDGFDKRYDEPFEDDGAYAD